MTGQGVPHRLTSPSNLSLTTWTLKCVSPLPPPDARMGAWWRWAAESLETTSEAGESAAVSWTGGRGGTERGADMSVSDGGGEEAVKLWTVMAERQHHPQFGRNDAFR